MSSEKDPVDDNGKKEVLIQAYETARAWASLLVSLATGIIVFTAVFKKDIAPQGQPLQAMEWLRLSWILLGISVVCGVLYLQTLIPQLNKGSVDKLDLYSGQSRVLGLLLWILFLAGLVAFGIFAWQNLR